MNSSIFTLCSSLGINKNIDLSQCKVSGTVRLLLTQFLRELPESLIPSHFLNDFLAAHGKLV